MNEKIYTITFISLFLVLVFLFNNADKIYFILKMFR